MLTFLHKELSQLHAEKKAQYDAFVASRDAQTLLLEQEVRVLREEARVEESRFHYLNAALAILQVQQFRLQEEMRGYLTSSSGAANGDGVTSLTVKRRSYRLGLILLKVHLLGLKGWSKNQLEELL